MVYKCVTRMEEIYKNDYMTPACCRLRVNRKQLLNITGKKYMQKFSFPTIAIDSWNRLSEVCAGVGAGNIHTRKFKVVYDEVILEDGTSRA